jgi:hypothetical protein
MRKLANRRSGGGGRVLLGQASGFEGIGAIEVLLAAHNLAIPDGEDDRQIPVGRDATLTASSGVAIPREDAVVANVDVSVELAAALS